MKWYLKVMRDNFANFSGRARREEYWMFVLINTAITIGLILVFMPLAFFTEIIPLAFLPHIYMLVTIIPSLGVLVRRLHDTDKSGWMYFVSLIPLAGPIWLLVLLATEGTKGDNKYGEDPKQSINDGFSNINSEILDENLLN